MSYWIGLFFVGFLLIPDCTESLRLLEVRIPNYVIKGSPAQLECLYDLDGEALYSVKWYKDGNEFYRYVPRDMPPAQTFLLPGVAVDVHNSSDAIVTLRTVNLQSAGRFRCEVSGEAPSFQTVTEGGEMVVVSLPDQGPPKITGGRPRYQVGDWVSINCTAGRSKPAVQLSWFVNGDQAEPHQLRRYETIVSGREGLETSVLGLQFRVEQYHFRNGDMKLKCIASLSTLYWRSNEESVEGDRPQKAPVLESRETVYASNSRADPVQASKTDSIMVAHAPNIFILLIPAVLTVLMANDNCLKQFFLFLSCMLIYQQDYTLHEQCESTENNIKLANVDKNNSMSKKQQQLLFVQNAIKTKVIKCTDATIPPPSAVTASSTAPTDDDDDDDNDHNDLNDDDNNNNNSYYGITANSNLVFCRENTSLWLADLMTQNNMTATKTTIATTTTTTVTRKITSTTKTTAAQKITTGAIIKAISETEMMSVR